MSHVFSNPGIVIDTSLISYAIEDENKEVVIVFKGGQESLRIKSGNNKELLQSLASCMKG